MSIDVLELLNKIDAVAGHQRVAGEPGQTQHRTVAYLTEQIRLSYVGPSDGSLPLEVYEADDFVLDNGQALGEYDESGEATAEAADADAIKGIAEGYIEQLASVQARADDLGDHSEREELPEGFSNSARGFLDNEKSTRAEFYNDAEQESIDNDGE